MAGACRKLKQGAQCIDTTGILRQAGSGELPKICTPWSRRGAYVVRVYAVDGGLLRACRARGVCIPLESAIQGAVSGGSEIVLLPFWSRSCHFHSTGVGILDKLCGAALGVARRFGIRQWESNSAGQPYARCSFWEGPYLKSLNNCFAKSVRNLSGPVVCISSRH